MGRYLVKVTEAEYKKQILLLLDRIHSVCVKNNIRYTIGFGSLIGAIRHKGFIPWDDDIDICMPREDYHKFVSAFTSSDGRYYVLDSNTSFNYYNNFSRACDGAMTLKLKGVLNIERLGAFIDIFFLDRWPETDNEREDYRREIARAFRNVKFALPLSAYTKLGLRGIIKALLSIDKIIYNGFFVGLKNRKLQRDEVLVKYANTNTGWRNVSFEYPRIRGLLYQWFVREENLDKRVLVQFENIKVYAPENYDELLCKCYGDYMKLPPESKQKTHHHFTPYWNDRVFIFEK